jgi:tRNA(Ile)-lysidine synthase
MKGKKPKYINSSAELVEAELARFLIEQRILGNTDSTQGFLAAVSGGSDSMALLAAHYSLYQADSRVRLCAAHLLHHPDSVEAHRRAEFVRHFCAEFNIPLVVKELISRALVGESPEAWMRRERYAFLQATALEQNCAWIVTAHHRDDQAETVLQRVVAGTGLHGLAAIKARRGTILRPLLGLEKKDLLNYCIDHRIPFADDPTNDDLRRTRNSIRHVVLPLLEKELNPKVRTALYRLGRWASEADELIEAQAAECLGKAVRIFQKGEIVLDIDAILPYFNVIRKTTLRNAICRVAGSEVQLQGHDLDRLADLMLFGRTGTGLEYPGRIRVLKHRRELIITCGSHQEVLYKLTPGSNQELPGLRMQAIWSACPSPPYHSGDTTSADLALGDFAGDLVLRNAQEGDHFFPLGAPGPKRLFRFLRDRNVPRWHKSRTLVLELNQEIIWVVKQRISQKVRVDGPENGNWRLCLRPMKSSGETKDGIVANDRKK